jgi:AraC-like DNA-binding protein
VRYWTTDDRPAAEQFSYWREVICEAFTPLAAERTRAHLPVQTDRRAISSWVRSRGLTATNCAEVASATQLITHGAEEVRRTGKDHVFVNLQLAGHCVASQDGRDCVVRPGGFALFDTSSQYSLEFVADPDRREWHVVSFRVPRAQLVPLLADPQGFTSVAHDGTTSGLAQIVASTMMSTWDAIDTLDVSSADAAETAFTTVLAAAAGGNDQLRETRRGSLDDTLRASINRYLAGHIRRPNVSAALVAQRFGISVRKLHKLYESCDLSFAQTVMAFRTDGVARELATDPGGRSLTELAARWGFSDLSHLNRVFRSRYDCLPSQYRESHRRRSIS